MAPSKHFQVIGTESILVVRMFEPLLTERLENDCLGG
jgi:hypothetical protein